MISHVEQINFIVVQIDINRPYYWSTNVKIGNMKILW